MAVTPNSAVTPQTPKITPTLITNATGTTIVTAFTAGPNGSKVTACIATNTDVAVAALTLYLTRGGINYAIGAYLVPANAGSNGSNPNADLLAGGPASLIVGLPVDNDNQKYLFLENGDTLSVGAGAAVGVGKIVTVIIVAAHF